MTELRTWQGGACPTHPDAKVTVTYVSGYNSGQPVRAGSLRWSRTGDAWDIAEYAVLDVPNEVRA